MRKRKSKPPGGVLPSDIGLVARDDSYVWPRRTLGKKLVNNLSVDDARHLLKCEGGALTPRQLGAVAALAVGAYWQEEPWQRLLVSSVSTSWRWITEAHMQWPLLWSVVEALLGLRYRVANLYEHGPPFVGVSLGCAMRFVVLLVGLALVPFVAEFVSARPAWLPWIVWGVIALSEGLALGMHWDIQQRLRKLDAVEDKVTRPDDVLPL